MSRRITERIRVNARAFLIWRVASAHDWNCTSADIADELQLPVETVASVCTKRGWAVRMRVRKQDTSAPAPLDFSVPRFEAA